MNRIHPTADVQPTAMIADDVEIGAYAIIEDDVVIGAGSVIRPHAVVRRYTRMGCGNFVDSHAVLGGDPQDLKYDPNTVSCLEIGDNNIFREGATISRATGNGQKNTQSEWVPTPRHRGCGGVKHRRRESHCRGVSDPSRSRAKPQAASIPSLPAGETACP